VHATELEGPLHTLYHPILSDVAGKAFYRRDQGNIPFTGYGEPARIGAKNSLWRRYVDYVGGRLPDEERLSAIEVALGLGRPHGISMLAKWMAESPDSPEFRTAHQSALMWLRLNVKEMNDPQRTLEDLRTLYEDSQLGMGKSLNAADAWRLSESYTSYYFHGAPFNEQSLRSAWARCQNQIRTEEACRARVSIEAKSSLKMMLGDEASFEKSVRSCMREARAGPQFCQHGEQQAIKLLRGDLSGFAGRAANPRFPL
jgi:hypothetical protein